MVLFYILCVILVIYKTSSEVSLQYGYFKMLPEHSNELPVIGITWTIINISRTRCAGVCMRDLPCKSFFFIKNTTQSICYGFTYKLTDSYSVIDRDSRAGIKYYELFTGCETSGYVYNSTLNICFKVYNKLLSKYDAENVCHSENGNLIVLDTQEKNNYVTSFTKLLYGSCCYWIGITDEQTEGIWQWRNGKPVIFTAWSPGQPNDYDQYYPQQDERRLIANCAAFDGNGLWIDDNCDHPHPFVCEISIHV